MDIENKVFKKVVFDTDKLIKYGFKKIHNTFYYECNFYHDKFKAQIIIVNNNISGKVIDLKMNDEYFNIKSKMNGSFVNEVRDNYINILNDIKHSCCSKLYFINNQSNEITRYIMDNYSDIPEFLWKDNDAGVFRNKKSKKWYGIIMKIDKSKISNLKGETEVIILKIDPKIILKLLTKDGYYKAYHMNKKYWITIILDGTIPNNEIFNLIDASYNNVL